MSNALPALVDLDALGAAGFKIQGENAGDGVGRSVSDTVTDDPASGIATPNPDGTVT